ncbi:MAG: alpha/beta fold hydrolase [Acidimicrobiia bacterium]
MDETILSGDVKLGAHLALPSVAGRTPAIVLCHGFPSGPSGSAIAGATYPELANRIARESGWAALAFNYRGSGASDGDFSVPGWCDDIRAAVDSLVERDDVIGVWLMGSGLGGSLAIAVAAHDERVRGVAVLNAYQTCREWVRDPSRFVSHARRIGVIRDDAFPPDVNQWARDVAELDSVRDAQLLPQRPLLVLHGSDDDVVPVEHARAIAEAAGDSAELRIVYKAGHRLRHDPRAVAALLGWLDRQVY